jgi:hypothetical protein
VSEPVRVHGREEFVRDLLYAGLKSRDAAGGELPGNQPTEPGVLGWVAGDHVGADDVGAELAGGPHPVLAQ